MEFILAIDGGGSRTRCLGIDRDGHVVGEGISGPSNHLLVDLNVVKQSLAEGIDQTFKSGRVSLSAVACLSAGLAGVDFDGAGAPEMAVVLRELGFERTVINGDMVIAHAGALGLGAGVVALAGTGSVILGVAPNGQRVKIGGWGPIYGDEGSAYRIGQMALTASARAYDGRGSQTTLKDEISRVLGLKDFKETISQVYSEAMQPRDIARLSRVAYEVAEAGDEVARGIFFRAGEDLAEGVKAAVRQMGLDHSKVVVSYQGAVLESCALLRERFIQTLQQELPECQIVEPRFEPVVGAYLLGRKALGWELSVSVLKELENLRPVHS